MPPQARHDWHEDETSVTFVLYFTAKAGQLDVLISPLYIKVNSPPHFFDADLPHPIDDASVKNKTRVGKSEVRITLQKQEPGLWGVYRAQGTKEELRKRREDGFARAAAREAQVREQRKEREEAKAKHGQESQWRIDNEQRQELDAWKQEEKRLNEQRVFGDFDARGELLQGRGDQLDRTTGGDLGQTDLDALDDDLPGDHPDDSSDEEGFPEGELQDEKCVEVSDEEAARIEQDKARAAALKAQGEGRQKKEDELWKALEQDVPQVRPTTGKMILPFSKQRKPGVPARDRPGREPPVPQTVKQHAKAVKDNQAPRDENDPVWLKEKADKLLTDGNYEGAFRAYSELLKEHINPYVFANRAVACLYLGAMSSCIDDCTRSIQILDMRNKAPAGMSPPPEPPEMALCRATVHARMAVAYLWGGKLARARDHFQKALDVEGGVVDAKERQRLRDDLAQVAQTLEQVADKKQASEDLGRAMKENRSVNLGPFDALCNSLPENAVVKANRAMAHLGREDWQQALDDCDECIQQLHNWPVPVRAPMFPKAAERLEAPTLDNHTFVNPHEKRDDEWLMKQEGCDQEALPEIPEGWEWTKDASAKNPMDGKAWIAVKKKLTKQQIDTIRENIEELQQACFDGRSVQVQGRGTDGVQNLEQAIQDAKALLPTNKGPSLKAINQAGEYLDRLKASRRKHEHLDDLKLERVQEERKTKIGSVTAGFGRKHPLSRARERLLAKVLLRRAKALEQLGRDQDAVEALTQVLRLEKNTEALEAMARLRPMAPPPVPAKSVEDALAEVKFAPPDRQGLQEATGHVAEGGDLEDLDEEDTPADGPALAQTASKYIAQQDFKSAVQMLCYALKSGSGWKERPLSRLRALANLTLALQKQRSSAELIPVADGAVQEIRSFRLCPPTDCLPDEVLTQVMLNKLECAVLSRRGWAHHQHQNVEKGDEDARRVKQLLQELGEA